MAKTMVFIDSRVNDLDLLVSQFDAGTEYKVLDGRQQKLYGKIQVNDITLIFRIW